MESFVSHLMALGVAFVIGWIVVAWWTRRRNYSERIAERLHRLSS